MKYYAVIDTNVLVSAMIKIESIPGEVATEALIGDIIPVLNSEILAEYEDVLRRPKFHFDEEKVGILLEDLCKRALYVEGGLVDEYIPDEKDVVFYAVLMEKRKEEEAYLVTGNIKHFPDKTYVVTPKEMMEIVEKDRG